jgi:hypothetical protein
MEKELFERLVQSMEQINHPDGDFVTVKRVDPKEGLGLWGNGQVDGLEYERALREEWDVAEE